MMLTTKEQIQAWLAKQYVKGDYFIHDDLTIDIMGDFHLIQDMDLLPVQFNKIEGVCWANDSSLTSLKGFPTKIGQSLDVSGNELTSLKYAPEHIGGDFIAAHNALVSTHFFPKYVGGNIILNNNALTTLIDLPREVKGDFKISYNELTSLDGSPQTVIKTYDCSYNQIKDFHGISDSIEHLICDNNNLTHFTGLKSVKSISSRHNQFEQLHDLPQCLTSLYIEQSTGIGSQLKYLNLQDEELEKLKLHYRLLNEVQEKPSIFRKKI